MSTILDWSQLAGILGLITTVVILYRLYVDKKDATIQLLKEKNEWLQDQLKQAKEQAPDVLIESLNKRVAIMKDELERSLDDTKSKEVVIQDALKKLDQINQRLQGAIDIADRIKQ